MAVVSTSQFSSTGSSVVKNGDVLLEPVISNLPLNVQQQLTDLEHQVNGGELTELGYQKRRSVLLNPYLIPCHQNKETREKNEELIIEPEMDLLPKAIMQQLSTLDDEFNEGEITEKGYRKRRNNILSPYLLREPARGELPLHVQQEYSNLELELKEGDITEKGFKKKKLNLIKPYLITVHPESYNNLPINTNRSEIGHDSQGAAISIQSVMADGKKLFKCGICGEVFKQAHSFSGHCRLHRAERKKDFKCSICTAAYSTRSHLKFHMYKHTGNFPFTCSYCGKGFAGRSQFKSHESRHTGESPYPCSRCDAKFWKMEHLEVHMENTCFQKWTPNESCVDACLNKDGDSRKTSLYKNVTQSCESSFNHSSDVLTDQMQDFSHLSTINLADVRTTSC